MLKTKNIIKSEGEINKRSSTSQFSKSLAGAEQIHLKPCIVFHCQKKEMLLEHIFVWLSRPTRQEEEQPGIKAVYEGQHICGLLLKDQ